VKFATSKKPVSVAAVLAVAALSLNGLAAAAPKHTAHHSTQFRVSHVGYTGTGAMGGWRYPSSTIVGYTGNGPLGGWSYPSGKRAG
jgi:hypothetical protein